MRQKGFYIYAVLLISIASCNKSSPQSSVGVSQAAIDEALFTNPELIKSNGNDTGIMDSLIYYMDHAPQGSIVHINIFAFNYKPLLEAVENAYQRGVTMNVIIDASVASSIEANQESISVLQSILNDPSKVTLVKSDVTSTSIDHEKYVLFSKVDLPGGSVHSIVFATSHNFILDGTKKMQDAILMSNKGLYNAFLKNWNEVASHAQSDMKNFTYEVADVGDSIKAFFFPRRQNGKWDGSDTILELLSKLNGYPKDSICVLMSDWTRVEIAERLVALQKKGVNVEVIVKSGGSVSPAVMSQLNLLREAGGYLKVLVISQENVHSKVMLIKGIWNGKQQQIILCGSHNYTYNALKNNNEFLLMLKNSMLFSDYWNYFFELKRVL